MDRHGDLRSEALDVRCPHVSSARPPHRNTRPSGARAGPAPTDPHPFTPAPWPRPACQHPSSRARQGRATPGLLPELGLSWPPGSRLKRGECPGLGRQAARLGGGGGAGGTRDTGCLCHPSRGQPEGASSGPQLAFQGLPAGSRREGGPATGSRPGQPARLRAGQGRSSSQPGPGSGPAAGRWTRRSKSARVWPAGATALPHWAPHWAPVSSTKTSPFLCPVPSGPLPRGRYSPVPR